MIPQISRPFTANRLLTGGNIETEKRQIKNEGYYAVGFVRPRIMYLPSFALGNESRKEKQSHKIFCWMITAELRVLFE